jgi:hypothetical protein
MQGVRRSENAPWHETVFLTLARIPEQTAALTALAPSDEPLVVDAFARHGLSGWVSDAFHSAGLAVPPRLLTDARASVAAAHRIKRLTVEVIDAFSTAGITPLALKGSVLAARLYPANPLVRVSSDVDVLVAPEELPLAETALRELALRRVIDPALEDVFEEHHHLSFGGPRGLVEVHFRLTQAFGGGVFDDAAIRARSIPYQFEGRTVRILSPEDEFIYLATHAANHGFLRLAWLVDLQQFVRLHPSLDFDAMAARAEAAGFLVPVQVTLALLERLLSVVLPPGARRAFPVRRRLTAVGRTLFSTSQLASGAVASNRLASVGLRALMADSVGSAARELISAAKRVVRRRLS